LTINPENKAALDPIAANVCEPPPPREAWFCAALAGDGSTTRRESESAEGFVEILAQASVGWVDYSAVDFDSEVLAVAAMFGFTKPLVNSLACNPQVNYQDFDTEMGLRLPSVRVAHFEVKSHPLLMLLSKNFVMTIHPQNTDTRFGRLRRYSDTMLKKIPFGVCKEDKLTYIIIRIIDENNDSNFQHLRRIEEQGDELNQDLMSPSTQRDMLAPKIYKMKHALIGYMDSLWETADVINALRYGDAELITNDPVILDRVGVLSANVSRQLGLAEHMSEVLASGLEVMQTIYNNQLQMLNNRLALIVAYLTILGTALLVPNTIATIFGNPAFNMGPQDVWWYTALLIGSTIIATALSFWWVRKRGWIPNKTE
jgi:magnesium transporter